MYEHHFEHIHMLHFLAIALMHILMTSDYQKKKLVFEWSEVVTWEFLWSIIMYVRTCVYVYILAHFNSLFF